MFRLWGKMWESNHLIKDIVIDEQIKYEWARIPHFYSDFYVYKYSTGVSAAIAIATKILNKEPGFVEKYIEMLKQGCSKKSIDLLKTFLPF